MQLPFFPRRPLRRRRLSAARHIVLLCKGGRGAEAAAVDPPQPWLREEGKAREGTALAATTTGQRAEPREGSGRVTERERATGPVSEERGGRRARSLS